MIDLDKSDLKWLQKALNKKDVRWFCNCILVKDGYAWATNGHVLHKVTCNGQEGKYARDGILDGKLVDNVHPLEKNWERLVSGFPNVAELSVMTGKLGTLKLSETIGINAKYFYDAVDGASAIALSCDEDKTKVKLEYSNRQAVIMGVKL